MVLVTGQLPPCLPEKCICADGTEQPVPSLPRPLLKTIQRTIERVASKVVRKLAKVCDNGEDPSVCECDNALVGELTFPVEDEADILKCKPSR